MVGKGFDLELTLHAGAGAYICGEETALLDSLEGFPWSTKVASTIPSNRRAICKANSC